MTSATTKIYRGRITDESATATTDSSSAWKRKRRCVVGVQRKTIESSKQRRLHGTAFSPQRMYQREGSLDKAPPLYVCIRRGKEHEGEEEKCNRSRIFVPRQAAVAPLRWRLQLRNTPRVQANPGFGAICGFWPVGGLEGGLLLLLLVLWLTGASCNRKHIFKGGAAWSLF